MKIFKCLHSSHAFSKRKRKKLRVQRHSLSKQWTLCRSNFFPQEVIRLARPDNRDVILEGPTDWAVEITGEGRQNCVTPWKRKRKTSEVAHTHIAGAFLLIPDLFHTEQQIATAKVGLDMSHGHSAWIRVTPVAPKERRCLGPSASCSVYGFQAYIRRNPSAQPVELMIGSFWNLCRACPSMPVDKVNLYK